MNEFPELKRNEFEAFLLQFSKPGSLKINMYVTLVIIMKNHSATTFRTY
jgi:hypothetical protein